MKPTLTVIGAALLSTLVACANKEETTTTQSAKATPESPSPAQGAAKATASAEAQIGGQLVAVGEHQVELKLFRDGYADLDYLKRHTDFPAELRQHLSARDPAWAAAITGLGEAEIVDFARLYGRTERSYIRLGYGFTRSRNGAANMHAATCLPAVTGAWRHRGGGASELLCFRVRDVAREREVVAAVESRSEQLRRREAVQHDGAVEGGEGLCGLLRRLAAVDHDRESEVVGERELRVEERALLLGRREAAHAVEPRLPHRDRLRMREELAELVQPARIRPSRAVRIDAERCVLCSRCIRFSDTVSGTSQFGFFDRGARMEIGTYRDRPLADPYAGCYADVCPVGALTSADFRFNARVWFLKRANSTCP